MCQYTKTTSKREDIQFIVKCCNCNNVSYYPYNKKCWICGKVFCENVITIESEFEYNELKDKNHASRGDGVWERPEDVKR